jgi:hypothetical protein
MKSGQNFNFCCIDPGLARSLQWQANRDAQLWVEMAQYSVDNQPVLFKIVSRLTQSIEQDRFEQNQSNYENKKLN